MEYANNRLSRYGYNCNTMTHKKAHAEGKNVSLHPPCSCLCLRSSPFVFIVFVFVFVRLAPPPNFYFYHLQFPVLELTRFAPAPLRAD